MLLTSGGDVQRGVKAHLMVGDSGGMLPQEILDTVRSLLVHSFFFRLSVHFW